MTFCTFLYLNPPKTSAMFLLESDTDDRSLIMIIAVVDDFGKKMFLLKWLSAHFANLKRGKLHV